MYGFEFVNAQSVDDAGSRLVENGAAANIIAGGTDLLGELKQGTISPQRLVSLQGLADLRGIVVDSQGVKIGAMTTIAEIAAHPVIRSHYTALAQACDSVATPQIRNVGTLGGNLCQRPRCWYYRSPLFDCRKKGGTECFALDGANKFHAIFDNAACPIVHPSDTAVALSALDASVMIAAPNEIHLLPIQGFFSSPSADATTENVLGAGEILSQIIIPRPSPNSRSIFLKAKERQAMDFALASVALSLDVVDDVVANAHIALGGVAPTPYKAADAEQALAGKPVSNIDAGAIGQAAVRGATPLSDNIYKVRLASRIVARAARTLLRDYGGDASQ